MIRDDARTKAERSAGLGRRMKRSADGNDASALTPAQLAQLPDHALTPTQLTKRLKNRVERERYKANDPELFNARKRAQYSRAKARKLTGEALPPPLSAEERRARQALRRKRFKIENRNLYRERHAAEKRRATARRRDDAVARSEELLRTHTLDTGDITHGG